MYSGLDLEEKLFILTLRHKGLSYRKIGEIVNVSYVTVYNYCTKYYQLLNTQELISNKDKVFNDVEIDELFTFIKKKKRNYIFG